MPFNGKMANAPTNADRKMVHAQVIVGDFSEGDLPHESSAEEDDHIQQRLRGRR